MVIIGTIVTTTGVIFNNVFLNHIMAMLIWTVSNTVFTVFFFGRGRKWWDGGLADDIMCGTYLVMLVSGVYGLWQMGVI